MSWMVGMEDTIRGAVERYRCIDAWAVRQRGVNECMVLEVASKITETSYVVAKPYSGADFLHGPIAMVGVGFPCFLYAPDGRAYPPLLEVALKVRERKGELVVFAHSPEIRELATRSLEIPVLVDELLS